MRIKRVLVSSVFASFGFVACASGGGGSLNDGGIPELTADAAGLADRRAATIADGSDEAEVVPAKDGATTRDARIDTGNSFKMCVPNCGNDSDCQATCPAAPNGGINCCDTSSGVCYASATSVCRGLVDAGFD